MKTPLVYLLITMQPHFSKAVSATQDVNLPAEEAASCNLMMRTCGAMSYTKELLVVLGLVGGLL